MLILNFRRFSLKRYNLKSFQDFLIKLGERMSNCLLYDSAKFHIKIFKIGKNIPTCLGGDCFFGPPCTWTSNIESILTYYITMYHLFYLSRYIHYFVCLFFGSFFVCSELHCICVNKSSIYNIFHYMIALFIQCYYMTTLHM